MQDGPLVVAVVSLAVVVLCCAVCHLSAQYLLLTCLDTGHGHWEDCTMHCALMCRHVGIVGVVGPGHTGVGLPLALQ